MAHHEEGGKWGLGELVKERRSTTRITPIEVLMKLHKTPIASRPVGRAYKSQMKVFEQLVAGILTQVLESVERGPRQIKLECGIYRKKAAADMYIPSSAHSKKLRQGIVKGEFLGFILLCSTEEEFDKA